MTTVLAQMGLPALAAVVTVLAAASIFWVTYLVIRSRTDPPTIGAAGSVLGAVGVVREATGTTGQVLVDGARWRAVSSVPLNTGMRVRVIAVEGLTITVLPADHESLP